VATVVRLGRAAEGVVSASQAGVQVVASA